MLKTLLFNRHLTHFQAGCYALLAYALFTFCDSAGKWLMSEGYAQNHVLTFTNIPSFILLTLFMIRRHGIQKCYYTHYKLYHALRALSLVGVTYFVFNALQKLELADFYGIMFSAPFVTTIAAFLIFKEKIDMTEWLVILIGFSGVLIVVQPDYAHFNFGYLYALGAVLSVTAAGLIVRKIGRDEDPFLFVIFANMAIIASNIIPALQTALPTIEPMHLIVFSIYALIIPVAILVLTAVFSRAPTVGVVAPFQYTQIIWGGIIGYVVFDNIPQVNTWIGSAVVIACGLYIMFHHKRKSRKELEQKP